MGLDALDEVGDADVVRGQSEGCADLDEFGFALAEERAGENAVGVLHIFASSDSRKNGIAAGY